MKNFIIWLLIAFTFIGSVVYFVFSSEGSLSITYIKFNINPEFIIGINNKDEVKIYNPLNDDAKVLNLNMFNGYKLEETVSIILEKLERNNYLDISQIDITVITKSDEKISYYFDKIRSVINKNYSYIVLKNNKASHEELIAYSNEVSYDIKASFNNNDLKEIAGNVKFELENHVNNLINRLNISELELNDKFDALMQSDAIGYFEDYDLTNYVINNNDLKVSDGSNYDIKFNYTDTEYTFDIELNLILEYTGQFVKEEQTYNKIEEYRYTYKNNEIYGLRTNFYKFI